MIYCQLETHTVFGQVCEYQQHQDYMCISETTTRQNKAPTGTQRVERHLLHIPHEKSGNYGIKIVK